MPAFIPKRMYRLEFDPVGHRSAEGGVLLVSNLVLHGYRTHRQVLVGEGMCIEVEGRGAAVDTRPLTSVGESGVELLDASAKGGIDEHRVIEVL